MTDPNADMHKRSNMVHEVDPLVELLYDLLRDHIQPSVLEALVRNTCDAATSMKVYSNGWLAAYAKDIAFRLDVARNKPHGTSIPVTK